MSLVQSRKKTPVVLLVSLLFITSITQANSTSLSLNKAISIAQHNDLWLVESYFKQKSAESLSVAVGTLPDPKISVTFANLPTDTFDFDQEPMTQFKVGVSQMFPRGDTLAIKREQLETQSDVFPFQRLNRSEQVKVTVTHLWLDAFKAQMSIALIEKDRELFEQLADVAQASYATALGRTKQQDIIRAQLELTRLEDRLAMLQQMQDTSIQKLSQWLNDYFLVDYSQLDVVTGINDSNNIQLDSELPNIPLGNLFLYDSATDILDSDLFQYLSHHPSVIAIKQKIAVSDSGIKLAKQKYKPAWSINASYGYRDENPLGMNRADFLSVGISFDVPLFTKNRQDKQLQSAVAMFDAAQTQEWALLRKMLAAFKTNKAKLLRLDQRQALYQNKLLPQIHQQAQASLNAYTNDTGDFAEVVRSRIAELNAQIDALGISVDRQKTIAQLNYFFLRSMAREGNLNE